MDKKTAEAIGLLRHKIISPVLMESGRNQMTYFRTLEKKSFDVPGSGACSFRAATMKSWLHKYKKHGFAGILPKSRSDAGSYRRCDQKAREAIKSLRCDDSHMSLSVKSFYQLCLEKEILGTPPLCLATVRRFLKNENLLTVNKTSKRRKKFEHGTFGELWTGDYMHGPLVCEHNGGKKRRKAILMAIIDDHSRVIVGAEFGFQENTLLVEKVFKDALLQYGICDRFYVDNGPSFSSQYLAKVCAQLGIALVHSKPYDSPSRGKIERFFRTIRQRFFSLAIKPSEEATLDLRSLNERFQTWLRNNYHLSHHKGINMRPIDRYQTSICRYPRKQVDEDLLEEFFFASLHRTVNNDCTVRVHNRLYEMPPHTVGQRVELKFSQENPNTLYFYENNQRVQKLTPLDIYANAKEYRPSPRDPHISLQSLFSKQSDKGAQND